MQKIISFLIAILSLAVICALALASWLTFEQMCSLGFANFKPTDFSLLPAVAISSGVLVAVLAYVRDRSKHELERKWHTSEVMLERIKDGLDTTIKLLSDRNNSRVTWVRASRTLLQALELKNQMLTEEHRIACALEEERARNELFVILSVPNKATGERTPLPPQFFYGIEDWETTKTLDEAALKASSHVVTYTMNLDHVPPQPYLKSISVKSVVAVFDFLEYPKNYDDPLDKVEVWSEDWSASHGIDQGARRCIEHTKRKTAIGGKLVERGKS